MTSRKMMKLASALFSDPELKARIEADPDAVADEWGLDETERERLRSISAETPDFAAAAPRLEAAMSASIQFELDPSALSAKTDDELIDLAEGTVRLLGTARLTASGEFARILDQVTPLVPQLAPLKDVTGMRPEEIEEFGAALLQEMDRRGVAQDAASRAALDEALRPA